VVKLVKHRFPQWQGIHQALMTLGLFSRVGESGNMLPLARKLPRRANDGNNLINDGKTEDTNWQLLNLHPDATTC
jgi:hypothetical protein